MGWISGVHVEVNFAGAPLVTLLAEQGGDKAQQGGFVGKERGNARAPFEFLVHPFDGVAGAHPPLVGRGQRIDGEALRDVELHPGGEFGGVFGMEDDALFEPRLRRCEVSRGEDGADAFSHLGTHLQTRDIGLGVLLEMELAALPGHRGKDGLACGGHAWMGVADDELGAAEAACDQRREELAPMHLRLAEGYADAQDGAFAIQADADGNEHGTVH